jgi:thiol-disulfide isomerase/thioredoxin
MRFRVVPALLLGVLLIGGCAANGEQGADTSARESSSDTANLAFTGETLDGSSFDGTELAGKPAVLWFWAPWCPTCRAQGPGVSGLADKYDGQVNVVGVGGLGDVGDIRDYAEQVDGPVHLIDPDGAVWRHFGVTAQSTYVVLDADGDVVADGYLDDHVLADTVAELVG